MSNLTSRRLGSVLKTKSSRNGDAPPRAARTRQSRLHRWRHPEIGEAGLELRDAVGNPVHEASAPVIASLRSLLARLRVGDGVPERLGVISAIRGEGVTSVCRSLALVLASDAAKNVCIVDLNWWAPAAWPAEGDHAGGVAEVLSGRVRLADALVGTDNPRLFVLPAGEASITERPILASSPDLATILASLTNRFDHVLVDLPAVHATSEALALAEHAGAIAVVVRQGVTSESQVKATLEELSGVPVLGVILNAAGTSIPGPFLHRMIGA